MQRTSGPPSVGDIIHEMYLNPSAISVAQAATLCGLECAQLAAVIRGQQPVTEQIAIQLAQGFDTEPQFWLERYTQWLAARIGSGEQQIYQPELELLARQIVGSYQTLVGQPLLDNGDARSLVEQLYHLPAVVLAHNGGDDPCFTYANLTAQRLWEMEWDQLVGMPSRYSAEPDHRESRAKLLAQVQARGYIDNYRGVRVSASGQRFEIQQAVVFNLLDQQGRKVGQAATFADWRML